VIEVQNLTKRYGNILAVDRVSFRIESGEIVGFLGPNGAGKTTTMRVLTGFIPPTSGRAIVADFDVMEKPLEVKRRIGYLPEHPPIYNDMLVSPYLDFVARLKEIDSRERPPEVRRVMDLCGLTEVQNRLIGNLSRGFRQRVGLAQALLGDPEILVLDEPTIGLDPRQIVEIRELIKNLRAEHTIILSSHILPEVEMICSRVIIIHEGKIVAEDQTAHLQATLRNSDRLFVQVGQAGPQALESIRRVPGVISVLPEEKVPGGYRVELEREGQKIREDVARAIVTGGFGLRELKPVGMSLEEVFVRLTTVEGANPEEGRKIS